MAKLKDFPPAEHLEVAQPNWDTAPYGMSGLSDPLTCANFDAMLNQFDTIDPYGRDWETVVFKHWHVGEYEVAFVRPGSKVAERAAILREEAIKFPCVDIELWENYEDARKPE